jgi:hypothetical protein
MIKEKLVTIPGSTVTGTEITRVGGTMPSVAAAQSGQALPYLNGAPAGSNPLTNGSDSMSLPMFSPSTGNTDSGVGHSGDLGGAGA